jgi:hypothetical protein
MEFCSTLPAECFWMALAAGADAHKRGRGGDKKGNAQKSHLGAVLFLEKVSPALAHVDSSGCDWLGSEQCH